MERGHEKNHINTRRKCYNFEEENTYLEVVSNLQWPLSPMFLKEIKILVNN